MDVGSIKRFFPQNIRRLQKEKLLTCVARRRICHLICRARSDGASASAKFMLLIE